MLKIGIVTDPLSNLPPEVTTAHDIYVVPGLVYIDNQRFISRKEVSTDEILKIIGSKTLKTAVPPPGEYYNVYEEILDKYDTIISLHCPTKQTGFLKSAMAGAKRTKSPEKIKHIECSVATLGLGLIALATSDAARKISDMDELLQKIMDFSKRVDVIGSVNSFDYIKRSGRVKLKVAGTFASLLAIKPVLAMHGSQILLLEKTRNRQKSLEKLFEHCTKRIDPEYNPKFIGISHLQSFEETKKLENSIKQRFPEHQILITDVDPMIASNTGPGLILITYFGK